jgi:glycosyltransferase involved in cell wall biosynthesis
MRLLFVCQYFPPEIGAPSARTFEHARQWVADGHQVTVLTGFPNHPTGRIPPEYRGKVFQKETVDGITVWRSWLYATPYVGFKGRVFCFVSFMISAIITALLHRARYDVVVATSPQFFVAIAGYVISLFKRKPFVFEVRDMWPEGIVLMGLLKKDSTITRILERIELFLYRKATCIISVTRGFKERIASRGIDAGKIHVVRNGADLSRFRPAPPDETVREAHGLTGKFAACYMGNHGRSQGVKTILQAAEILKDRDDIRFLLIGEGEEKPDLVRWAEERELSNVAFVGAQPKESMPGLLAASNACFVPLRKLDIFKQTIPSKVFEIMASGRPVLLGVEGEVREIVEEAGGGIAVEPENPAELAEAVSRLAGDPDLARRMGQDGRAYVEREFDRKILARRMIAILEQYAPTPASAGGTGQERGRKP